MEKIGEWLGGNWGWVVAFISIFIEITPVKVHPVSSLLGWVGKKLNGQVQKEIEGVKADVAALKRDTDENFNKVEARQDAAERDSAMQRMAGIKNGVLDFANSCMNGRKHTKEEFDHVIAENAVYDGLVEKYRIQNEVYSESYDYILRVYRKCLDEHKFLMVEAD